MWSWASALPSNKIMLANSKSPSCVSVGGTVSNAQATDSHKKNQLPNGTDDNTLEVRSNNGTSSPSNCTSQSVPSEAGNISPTKLHCSNMNLCSATTEHHEPQPINDSNIESKLNETDGDNTQINNELSLDPPSHDFAFYEWDFEDTDDERESESANALVKESAGSSAVVLYDKAHLALLPLNLKKSGKKKKESSFVMNGGSGEAKFSKHSSRADKHSVPLQRHLSIRNSIEDLMVSSMYKSQLSRELGPAMGLSIHDKMFRKVPIASSARFMSHVTLEPSSKRQEKRTSNERPGSPDATRYGGLKGFNSSPFPTPGGNMSPPSPRRWRFKEFTHSRSAETTGSYGGGSAKRTAESLVASRPRYTRSNISESESINQPVTQGSLSVPSVSAGLDRTISLEKHDSVGAETALPSKSIGQLRHTTTSEDRAHSVRRLWSKLAMKVRK